MRTVKSSLVQLLGRDYMEAVLAGAAALYDANGEASRALAYDEIEFLPTAYMQRLDGMLDKIGKQVVPEFSTAVTGAPTDAFGKAAHLAASPLGGLGYIRLGEDGRLYLTAKSEHYHTPLGHNFPGYKLIAHAVALGITNATHNNTRGYITRLLERELVRTVNGLPPEDRAGLERLLSSREPRVLNRVLNLETGTLSCEAAIKMMLARFYKLEESFPEPPYSGRIPVFFVVGDNEGGGKANYHGTTVVAQVMRDSWPEMYDKLSRAGILHVCPVRLNDFADFQAKFAEYDRPPYKAAGFLHEIVLMNYGGIKLEPRFLQQIYEVCRAHDTPVMCDEIQSCMWYPGMYLFREYGLKPDFVVIGKGFPGGQYAASRLITTGGMDTLNQFGALVTNGQEELAALSYLITMKYAEENADYVGRIGAYYAAALRGVAERYPTLIERIEGAGHLSSIFFHETDDVLKFTALLNGNCIDISAQTYKAMCPPAALTKPPIIATTAMVDFVVGKMENALRQLVKAAS